MRKHPQGTSIVWGVALLLGWSAAPGVRAADPSPRLDRNAATQPTTIPARAARRPTTRPAPDPAQRDFRTALEQIRRTLTRGCAATALVQLEAARERFGRQPALHLLSAQALFELDHVLGAASLRTIPGGRSGQFADGVLLVEPRGTGDRFLCCGPDAALYHLRRALDGGVDEPAAHVLHARIWARLGHPCTGLRILQDREALLLPGAGHDVLTAYVDLAREAGALRDYLRYQRRLAESERTERDEVLARACRTVAEMYGQRGDARLYMEWLHRALDYRPDDAAVLMALADTEWNAGQVDRARGHYRRLLRLVPRHAERTRILERLAGVSPDER